MRCFCSSLVCQMLTTFAVIAHGVAVAELPEAISRAIEVAQTKYAEARTSAEKELLESFDAEIKLIRKQTKPKADEKQQLVEMVNAERSAFEEHGTLPFSPTMRTAMSNYLKRLRDARKPISQAYDKAIEHQTKSGDDLGASATAAEKKKIIDARSVAFWEVKGVTWQGGYSFRLLDDGTYPGGGGVWVLEKSGGITLRGKPGGNSPPEGWIESCVVEQNGQVMNATNQLKGRWRAKLVATQTKL